MRRPALLLLLASLAAAQPLPEALRGRIQGFQGTVSLYAKNLDTGVTVGIRDTDPVRTASTIKLPILCAVFDLVARGQAKWTDPLTITAAEKVSGSGVIASELSDGVQLPLRDVTHLMMVLSDNTATNMILQRFTADAVNAYLDRIGIKTTRSLRKIMGGNGTEQGWSAAGKLPENRKYGLGVSTPHDMVTILERLEQGEIVSPEASQEILAVMKRCQDGDGHPAQNGRPDGGQQDRRPRRIAFGRRDRLLQRRPHRHGDHRGRNAETGLEPGQPGLAADRGPGQNAGGRAGEEVGSGGLAVQARAFPYSTSKRLHAFSACGSL